MTRPIAMHQSKTKSAMDTPRRSKSDRSRRAGGKAAKSSLPPTPTTGPASPIEDPGAPFSGKPAADEVRLRLQRQRTRSWSLFFAQFE
jgi:hypothetical protein